MKNEDNKNKHQLDDLFEVTIEKDNRAPKTTTNIVETRQLNEDIKGKIDIFKQASAMYSHLQESVIKNNEVMVSLPQQLHAKYIVKSLTYLADEWITIRSSFIRQGESQNQIIIQLDVLAEEQIANMCAELNECIDHFIARAT